MTQKQSSVEWLIEQLLIYGDKAFNKEITLGQYHIKKQELIEQAKAMHKNEMIDFAYNCRNLMAGDEFAITHWYDKTFNTKEK